MKLTAAIILLIFLPGCKKSPGEGVTVMANTDTVKIKTHPGELSYLALGDSYTIGEAVAQDQSFPYQFAAMMNKQGYTVTEPKIVAKTGWTTGELILGINQAAISSKYDIVTLLIGVNNQYRGDYIGTYRDQFKLLLQTAIDFASGNKSHVFVLSIPDWGVTPFGIQSGQKDISGQIDAFNAVNKEETLALGISYTDITGASRGAAGNQALVASDGLH
ncbi:MAG TPA: SGNH/GDSL hydrolase family protein, partial [Pedobacter sp.]